MDVGDSTGGNTCNECEQLKEKYNSMYEENVALKSQIKELQKAILELSQDKENNVYEVERIMSHSLKGPRNKKELQFLIRWEGYDQSHDSWVSEKNLKCAAILKKYKKKNNI